MSYIVLPFTALLVQQLEMMATDIALMVDRTVKPPSPPEERAMPSQVPQRQ